MRCDYAACPDPAVTAEQGWAFCRPHYREHRADLHGEQWPRYLKNRPRVLSDQQAVWQQIEQLDTLGLSAQEIAARLRIAQRTVERYRDRVAA